MYDLFGPAGNESDNIFWGIKYVSSDLVGKISEKGCDRVYHFTEFLFV